MDLYWFEEIGDVPMLIRIDKAEEIGVPGTNLKLFHIKSSNSWLPRFTRGITPTMFFIMVTKNKELVNFTLRGIEKDLAEAKLSYDHTDMRWAAENMREFVKRNYKDKAVKWWKEYAGVITTAIYILIMTFSFVIILFFLRGVVEDIGTVASSMNTAIDKLNVCSPGSGVIKT